MKIKRRRTSEAGDGFSTASPLPWSPAAKCRKVGYSIMDTTPKSPAAEATGRQQESSLRVLVVDDDQKTADRLAEIIRGCGHDSKVAYDGAAALEAAASFRPDVALLDLAIPKPDGLTLARQLRRQSAFPPPLLVAISGFADNGMRRLCAESGFHTFFPKPLDLEAIQGYLATVEKSGNSVTCTG